MKTFYLLSLTFVGMLAFQFPVLSAPLSAADKLKKDEQLDKMAGLLANDWTINKININSRSKLPGQMQPGLPPYSQQPEQDTPINPVYRLRVIGR